MISIKATAQPQALLVLVAAVANVAEKLSVPLTITDGLGCGHARFSLHYALRAIDVRTHGVPDVAKVMLALSALLGPDYDVIWEAKGTANSHLHLEYDPS